MRRSRTITTILAGSLLLASVACPATESATDTAPPPRWWFGMQGGLLGAVAAPHPTRGSGGAHVIYGIEGGVRSVSWY